jgi:hypothetical protein
MEMIAVGPIFPEEKEFSSHCPVRDQMAALERGLAEALRGRGYNVLGKHSAPWEPDQGKLRAILGVIKGKLSIKRGHKRKGHIANG